MGIERPRKQFQLKTLICPPMVGLQTKFCSLNPVAWCNKMRIPTWREGQECHPVSFAWHTPGTEKSCAYNPSSNWHLSIKGWRERTWKHKLIFYLVLQGEMVVFSPAMPWIAAWDSTFAEEAKINTSALLGTWDMEKNSFDKNQPLNKKVKCLEKPMSYEIWDTVFGT